MIGGIAGLLASLRLWPERPGPLGFWFALGTSPAWLSLLAYAWLLLGKPGRGVLLALELAALAGVLGLLRQLPQAPRTKARGELPGSLAAVLGLAVAAAVAGMLFTFHEFPRGEWDAVDIWNARALAFLRAPLPDALRHAHHADYPLLLPLAVFGLWSWTGATPLVPMALATLFAAASAGLLYSAVARMRGRVPAAICTAVLLASPSFAHHAASQRADVALAGFVLAAAVALVAHGTRPEPRLLGLAGVALGGALWTKNEGILVTAVMAGCWWLGAGRPGARRVAPLLLGAAPFALALLHHKLTCGSGTDLFVEQRAGLWERLAQPARWATIGGAFVVQGSYFWLAGGALALYFRRRLPGRLPREARFLVPALGIVLAGYASVYALTPHDLAWHLETSLGRLLLQLWPLTLLILGLGARDASAPRAPAP